MGIAASGIMLNAKYSRKTCKRCGKQFVPLSGRAIYCPLCRIKRSEEINHATYMKRKEAAQLDK